MLVGLYIFVDDDYGDPIYADPDPEELDPELLKSILETVNEAFEGDRPASGTHDDVEDYQVGWRFHSRLSLHFVAVVDEECATSDLEDYLKDVQKHYLDEVDDPREPEREGVADVVVDVIPPWED